MDRLEPKDHAEAVALFRSQVIGPLACAELRRGELREALRELSRRRFRPPGSQRTRTYSQTTLERWYYALRAGGLDALRPVPRSDRGRARALNDTQRELLLAIRREYPRASAELILRTLVTDGRLPKGLISPTTLRRLYAQHGLDVRTLRAHEPGRVRLRWQAERPGQLWHADVCHGPALCIDGRSVPLRIHAILDDASRYIVAIEASDTEKEVEMLALMVKALRQHPAPDTLYLDNGPTYIGRALETACGRLDIALLHARAYDAPARGKMERFWRTLRQGCLDHLGVVSGLHDVQVRLLAFLDQHYHRAPHAGLMGRSPCTVYEQAIAAQREGLDENRLREALVVRGRRRVRRDNTISIAGTDFELDESFLAGQLVTVARTLAEPGEPPWVEHESKRLTLRPVDPIGNAKKRRQPTRRNRRGIDAVPFDPPGVLLDRALGRRPKGGDA